MKLIRFLEDGEAHAGVLAGRGVVAIPEINARRGARIPDDILGIIRSGAADELKEALGGDLAAAPFDTVRPLLPYDAPPKIWCIGLNYLSHAEDIQAVQPEEPGSFMKPGSSLFPPGGEILLPPPEISREVDAEGELGVIIGRTCRFVPAEHVPEVIFGYTTTLDLTALDVLRRNTRYLTRAKSIDTFFSFGPVVVTRDEIPNLNRVEVITERNGSTYSRDFVSNMRHRPLELVRFHSDYFTLEPGDLISTGCPKGARIQAGDCVAARIDPIGTLRAVVRQGDRRPRY